MSVEPSPISSPTPTQSSYDHWRDDQVPLTRPFSPRKTSANPNFSSLPPLVTSPPPQPSSTPRIKSPSSKTTSAKPRSSALPSRSRPQSMVFTTFHSSLSYASVRDFAYRIDHILHYGPQPKPTSTAPASRDRAPEQRSGGGWRGEPGEGGESPTSLELSIPAFGDGPPWKEDEDLLSPVVRTAKHKKSRSGMSDVDGRGRSGDRQSSRRKRSDIDANLAAQASALHNMDNNTSYTTQPDRSYFQSQAVPSFGDEDLSDGDFPSGSPTPFEDEDESRYSRDYQFHIASPDEEMHGKAVALFDFARENENELPLQEGQVLWVSYRHGQGWLVAQDPKTGENGLVPEEYVRMLKDIEGGLSGLNGQLPGLSPGSEGAELGTSPDADTPTLGSTAVNSLHERNLSGVSTSSEHYTPVVSHFTTSSKDLQPYAGPLEKGLSPRIVQQSPTRSPVRPFKDISRHGSSAADLVTAAREQMAAEEGEARNALRLSLGAKLGDVPDEDEDEAVILEDAVAREIRRSQGPPV